MVVGCEGAMLCCSIPGRVTSSTRGLVGRRTKPKFENLHGSRSSLLSHGKGKASPRTYAAGVRNVVKVSATAEDSSTPVCVVTGASRGIGRAIALALGESGAKVCMHPRYIVLRQASKQEQKA